MQGLLDDARDYLVEAAGAVAAAWTALEAHPEARRALGDAMDRLDDLYGVIEDIRQTWRQARDLLDRL